MNVELLRRELNLIKDEALKNKVRLSCRTFQK